MELTSNIYGILLGKPLGRPRRLCDDNIKMNLREENEVEKV
jgi:hypothetical protein